MSVISKREAIMQFANESEGNYVKVFTYINGCLQQIYYTQVELVVMDEEELPDASIVELYNYLFENDK